MIASMGTRTETPTPRKNPGGQKVWVARWTDRNGKVRYGNKLLGIKGTYPLRRDASAAIKACYKHDEVAPERSDTLGGYFATWTDIHPRSTVTNRGNTSRIRATLDIDIDGTPLRDWPLELLRRRHANMVKEHLLVVDGRAAVGVNGILGTLSAMVEDAIEDDFAVTNPFRGMKKVAATDPRIQKAARPVRVFTWEQMHEFARVAGTVEKEGGDQLNEWRRVHAEPMIRSLTDLGLRIGELLPLHRADLDLREATLRVQRTVSQHGEVLQGTKNDHGEREAGRTVPVPPELMGMLKRMMLASPAGQTKLLFPAPRGKRWFYTSFTRDVWYPAQAASGLDMRPHETRHSWESLLLAAGVDASDLAETAGHTVETQTKTYRHALSRSADVIRRAVGE